MAGLIWTVSGLGVGVTCVILLFMLLKYGSTKVHHSWAFFNLILGVWGFGAFFVGLSKDGTTAMVFWKIALLGAIPTSTAFYHMVVILGSLIEKRKLLIAFYTYSLIICALVIFDLAGIKVFYVYNSLYHIQAVDFRFKTAAVIWVSIIFYAVLELYRLFSKSSGPTRLQYLYLLIGFIIGFTGGVINALLMCGVKVFPIGNILISIYCILVTYAILRHQLLDIEIIIRRAAVFAGLFAFVYAVFAGMAYLTQLIFQNIIGLNRWIAMIPSVLIVIFTLRPFERFLINTTDKFLFQKKYDYKTLLKTFSCEVLTVLDLSKLVNLTVGSLSRIIRLESCAVLIYDKDKDNYPILSSLGLKESSQTFAKHTHLINYFLKTHHYLLKDKNIANLPDTGTVKEDLRKLNAEIVLPIILREDLMGILALGRKKSGEDFTQDDLDILLPLSQTLAVAISNAQYFLDLLKSETKSEKMKAVATLAAGMAHEIKNPLTAIKTFACFMPKYSSDKEFIDKFNRIVPESVNRIDRIVQDVLAFSKPTPPIFKPLKITEVITHTLDYVSNDLVKNNINYSFDFKDDQAIIQADFSQLTQVFLNLYLNAIEAMPKGGMLTASTIIKDRDGSAHQAGTPFTIQPNLSEKSVPILPVEGCPPSSSRIEIRISDTGCGISPENLKHIFDPFFTTKDKGTGLGLSIVREIVANHQGNIKAESESGKGTVFILEFPTAKAQNDR